ncbi:unnamed protein product [Chrysoparadoxa australica]
MALSEEADREIPFPFEPYAVQKQLMNHIYATLAKGGVGIFESPTGTGKSLSVICSALQWLIDEELKDEEVFGGDDESHSTVTQGGGLPDWLENFSANKRREKEQGKALMVKKKRQELRGRLEGVKQTQTPTEKGFKRGKGRVTKRVVRRRGWTGLAGRKRPAPPIDESHLEALKADTGDDFLLAEYCSDEDGEGTEKAGGKGSGPADSDSDSEEERKEERDAQEWEELGVRQILYCSRTHSQISQFVQEVKKTAFAPHVRCISLGSRRNLCVNPQVTCLGCDAQVNEACMDLQKDKRTGKGNGKGKVKEKGRAATAGATRKGGKVPRNQHELMSSTRSGKDLGHGQQGNARDEGEPLAGKDSKKAAGCPFLGLSAQRNFRDHALSSVHDMEELASLGEELKACPYYGTRRAAALAQLVVMPYSLLLQKEAREAMGIRIKGAAVIIDEAHNLTEAINAVHSAKLRLSEISRAHSQLSQYLQRYGPRLRGRNSFYVSTILSVMRALLKMLQPKKSLATTEPPSPLKRMKQGSGSKSNEQPSVQAEAKLPAPAPAEMVTRVDRINDFLFRAGIDNVNLFKLQRYVEKSRIGQKVMGFADMSAVEASDERERGPNIEPGETDSAHSSQLKARPLTQQTFMTTTSQAFHSPPTPAVSLYHLYHLPGVTTFTSKHISSLDSIGAFLRALTNSNQDGRVVQTYACPFVQSSSPPQTEEPFLKFTMLNPAVHFTELVEQARSIVLVGGTMKPTGDIVKQLFHSVPKDLVDVFSCGHVIPPQNLLPLCVEQGPGGRRFNFTFQKRATPQQLDELGQLLIKVCDQVPGGVVVFVASYSYLEQQVVKYWQSKGLLTKLQSRKSVFCEPRKAQEVSGVKGMCSIDIWYHGCCLFCTTSEVNAASCSSSLRGGLLLSVVGAKMSEGINFNDDLARCVVMVGLPYPNKSDPELKEKIAYLDEASGQEPGKGRAGREHFQNICMRSVNQGIGRSIRHAGDYACILLVDERYHQDSVVRLLPGWIGKQVVKAHSFQQVTQSMAAFFQRMR